MKKITSIFFITVFIFTAGRCLADEPAIYISPIVRVAVIKDASKLTLSIKSSFTIMPLEIDQVLCSDKLLKESLVVPTKYGVKIADNDFKVYGIRIMPQTDSAIYINNRSFRGEVDIIRQKNQTLLVVNYVNVEDYLRGVLYHEVSHWWPSAVLEAQAIASRTFALYQAKMNKSKDYDLECTVYSQVYGGATSEKFRTNEAVYRTIGKILMYKGEILPAYYHATCAGHTEDAFVLWKTDLAPLKGVSCGFCKLSPHFYWKKAMPVSDMENLLGIKNIQAVVPVEWDNSARITRLMIKTPDKDVDYTAKDFRQKLGGNVIKSTIFKIDIKPDKQGKMTAYVEGAGWGHGVGMCQWGAMGMALRGWTAEKILNYYYPGATIEIFSQ